MKDEEWKGVEDGRSRECNKCKLLNQQVENVNTTSGKSLIIKSTSRKCKCNKWRIVNQQVDR